MTQPHLIASVCLAGLLAAIPACKKQEDKPSPTASQAHPAVAKEATAPAAETTADHITVFAHHDHRKPKDPVRVDFERFRVVHADFDPQKIEGGTATIELDLSSLRTGSDERDADLESPAYLDVGTLATATITIDHVKHETGDNYSAQATVAAHGMTKTYPVTFDVLARDAGSIRIKGQHTFSRLDFGIGGDPAKDADEQVATDVRIEMLLTIPKT